ncbi:hypothetical protein OK016_21680 [Vibrio chagasii]|nr:hypothetical protein [Vibrio chagasii]
MLRKPKPERYPESNLSKCRKLVRVHVLLFPDKCARAYVYYKGVTTSRWMMFVQCR